MAKKIDMWIQDAIKNPGSFKAYCKRKGLLTRRGTVSSKCISVGCKSKNKTVKRRACLAKTLRKLRKKRR